MADFYKNLYSYCNIGIYSVRSRNCLFIHDVYIPPKVELNWKRSLNAIMFSLSHTHTYADSLEKNTKSGLLGPKTLMKYHHTRMHKHMHNCCKNSETESRALQNVFQNFIVFFPFMITALSLHHMSLESKNEIIFNVVSTQP